MFALCASTTADVGGLMAGIATACLLIVACIAGWIAKQQLDLQRQSERRRRVYEHLSQLYDRDFMSMMVEAQNLFSEHPEKPDEWAKLWKQRDDQQKAMVTAVLNFYEIVASEYNDTTEELLDRDVADKALTYVVDEMWPLAEPFVRWLRKKPGLEGAFDEMESMYRRVKREH